ncbi:hypothetical protein FA13DRAFT_283851 [Coprinellus micaceus]|uniref:Uncharacterized protein n=1 Tax=Coprinellus micaceus TaxID=71717 RepID=A0A4Y7TET9_COPMI|nr:hypothetical protein FA13DRAFT_283851 [Coprinellus micaceus]
MLPPPPHCAIVLYMEILVDRLAIFGHCGGFSFPRAKRIGRIPPKFPTKKSLFRGDESSTDVDSEDTPHTSDPSSLLLHPGTQSSTRADALLPKFVLPWLPRPHHRTPSSSRYPISSSNKPEAGTYAYDAQMSPGQPTRMAARSRKVQRQSSSADAR